MELYVTVVFFLVLAAIAVKILEAVLVPILRGLTWLLEWQASRQKTRRTPTEEDVYAMAEAVRSEIRSPAQDGALPPAEHLHYDPVEKTATITVSISDGEGDIGLDSLPYLQTYHLHFPEPVTEVALDVRIVNKEPA